jgi:hypothetical protein
LHPFKHCTSLWLINLRLERIFLTFDFFRVLLLVVRVLLHTTWHPRACLLDLGHTVDSLGTFFFLFLHLALVHWNCASNRDFVCSELRSTAFNIKTFIWIRVPFFFHLVLVPLPERERSFSLFGYLYTLLLNFQTTFFVFVKNLLVSRDEDRSWDWLASKLIRKRTFLFQLLFHHHLFNFSLPDSFRFDCFSGIKLKRCWDGNSVFAFFLSRICT